MVHERLHALDAVRGFALLAGVALHAAMSFLPGFAELEVPIFDVSTSLTLAIIFYAIHMFRMILFFVIAGFFGRMLIERDGTRAFVWNRFLRILLPLIVFWFIVFPPIVVAIIWGAYKVYGDDMPPMPRPTEALPFPLVHLWFLYVLVWLYAGTLLARGLLAFVDLRGSIRRGLDTALRATMHGPFATLILAAPLCVSLGLSRGWLPWLGIPTPDHSLIPNLSAMIAFSTAFAFGWMIERQRDLIEIWPRRWAIHLVMALATTIACFCLAGVAPNFEPMTEDWRRMTYAVCYTIGAWNWTFAIFGIALKWCSNHSPQLRYMADSSYWVYLIHLPLVFLLQVAVQDVPLHWTIKFPIVFGVSMLILIASYHWLVRSTFVGGWLNGRRYPRRPRPESLAIPAEGAA